MCLQNRKTIKIISLLLFELFKYKNDDENETLTPSSFVQLTVSLVVILLVTARLSVLVFLSDLGFLHAKYRKNTFVAVIK